jgi:hypothetical protein
MILIFDILSLVLFRFRYGNIGILQAYLNHDCPFIDHFCFGQGKTIPGTQGDFPGTAPYQRCFYNHIRAYGSHHCNLVHAQGQHIDVCRIPCTGNTHKRLTANGGAAFPTCTSASGYSELTGTCHRGFSVTCSFKRNHDFARCHDQEPPGHYI